MLCRSTQVWCLFVCLLLNLSIHRCGKCVQHLSKPLCCEDVTSIVCVLSFFVLWEILSLRAPSRCPLRHYAANSVMEAEQDLCSYTFLSSDTRIYTVDQASQCWTLRQLRGTELKKNYTCIASPTSTSPSFLHHLSNMDVQIHFAVPHSGVTRHVRMLYYLKNGLIFSIKGIFLKVYCKFYYLYMGFFLLVWATICIIHI